MNPRVVWTRLTPMKRVLILCAAILLVCCGIGTIGIVATGPTTGRTPTPASRTTAGQPSPSESSPPSPSPSPSPTQSQTPTPAATTQAAAPPPPPPIDTTQPAPPPPPPTTGDTYATASTQERSARSTASW